MCLGQPQLVIQAVCTRHQIDVSTGLHDGSLAKHRDGIAGSKAFSGVDVLGIEQSVMTDEKIVV